MLPIFCRAFVALGPLVFSITLQMIRRNTPPGKLANVDTKKRPGLKQKRLTIPNTIFQGASCQFCGV